MTTATDADHTWLALLLQGAGPAEFNRLRARLLEEAATAAERALAELDAERAAALRQQMIQDRRRVAELSALNDLALRLSAEHNLAALLQSTVTQARLVLGVDVAYLALAESDGSLIIRVTDGSIGSRLRGIHLPPRSGLAGMVFERAEPVQSADYVHDDSLVHSEGVDQVALEEGLRTIVGAPLRLRGEVTGVLMVAQRAVRRFDSWELSLLSSLGAFAGVAIDNARQLENHRRTAEELSAVNADLERNVASVNRATVLHDRLLDAALRGGGIEQVVSDLSTVVRGLVAFADERDTVVAAARGGGAISDVAVTEVGGQPPAERFSHPDQRRTWPDETVVTVPVASSVAYFGCLQVHPEQPLAPQDIRLLERAAMTIALLAQADRAAADADRRNTEDMLEQVFGGRADDSDTFRKRGLLLGLDLSKAQTVLVAEVEEGLPSRGNPLQAVIAPLGGVAGRVAGRPVAATPAGPDEVAAVLAALTPRPAALIGIGGPASGTVGLAAAYTDALACLRTLRALGRGRCWAGPADLGPYRFLLGQAGRDDAGRFIEATIGALIAHDRTRQADLVRTVEVFLASGRQHAATAAELHIHPNTLYQRLDRITAILGEGWREADRALEIQMATRMRQLLTAT